ncbi:MAG: hypothetical protein QOG50_3874 [Actinomycetota bacterium]|nr:hypothetical protein [Actinomycetota bacterium]
MVLVVAVLLIDLWVALRHPFFYGDSKHVVIGAQKIVDCFHQEVFTHCDKWAGGQAGPHGGVAPVGAWPLLQYVPAVALRWLGLGPSATLRVLIVIDALALWVMSGLLWITVRRTGATAWAPLLAVAMLASPLLWYGVAAFGEALAAAIVVAAIAAALLRGPPVLVGGLVALASIAKETNPAFVLALVVICVVAQTTRRPEAKPASRRLLVAAVVGAILGVAANAAFNVVRFGSVRNTIYLAPFKRTHDAAVVARAFAAQWVAPNGGLLWFWPCSIAIVGLTVAGAIWTLQRTGASWRTAAPLLVAGVSIVYVVGLSTWYSPFGWFAWGPRLMVPLVPAMLLMCCVLASERATYVLHRFMAGRALWPAALPVIALGGAEVAVLFQPSVMSDFFGLSRGCVIPIVARNPHAYYRCFDFHAWQKRPFLLQRGLEGFGAFGGRVILLAFVGAVIMLLKTGRTNAQRALALEPHEAEIDRAPAADPM